MKGDLESYTNIDFVNRRTKELISQKGIPISEKISPRIVAGWLSKPDTDPLYLIAKQVYMEFGENLVVLYKEISRITGVNDWNIVYTGGIAQGEAIKVIIEGAKRALTESPDIKVNFLIREDAPMRGALGAADLGLQEQQTTTTNVQHVYTEASPEEKARILESLEASRRKNLLLYLNRFKAGMSGFLRLIFRDEKNILDKMVALDAERVFHEGLIKDEDGVYWIVKRFNPNAFIRIIEGRKAKNFPHHEMLAFLMAQGIANLNEIRFVRQDEITGLNIFQGEICDYYLTRVVTSSNISSDMLPQQEIGKAFAGIFVANILMRKYDQHFNNVAYAHGIPVSIDNDEVFGYALFPNVQFGIQSFVIEFVLNSIILFVKVFSARDRVLDEDIGLIVRDDSEVSLRIRTGILQSMIKDFGLGGGFIAAEMLHPEDIREAIISFKKVENVRRLAEQAGYKGEELDQTVEYILSCQKSLGKDVDMVWELLSGRSADFYKLDDVYSIFQVSPELGQSL
jgi:hypothetical protein